jgi:hypothetical protein
VRKVEMTPWGRRDHSTYATRPGRLHPVGSISRFCRVTTRPGGCTAARGLGSAPRTGEHPHHGAAAGGGRNIPRGPTGARGPSSDPSRRLARRPITPPIFIAPPPPPTKAQIEQMQKAAEERQQHERRYARRPSRTHACRKSSKRSGATISASAKKRAIAAGLGRRIDRDDDRDRGRERERSR